VFVVFQPVSQRWMILRGSPASAPPRKEGARQSQGVHEEGGSARTRSICPGTQTTVAIFSILLSNKTGRQYEPCLPPVALKNFLVSAALPCTADRTSLAL